ncbi:helix-turn-helix domain-containing protein, partial [Ruoffia sp. FAM 20857]
MLVTTKTYTRRSVMSYTHLTIEERSKIEILYQEGYKINRIAQ